MATRPGGLDPVQKATKEVQELCDQVKPDVKRKTGKNYSEFTATSFRIQIVAGTNYFIKVHVGEEYIHLRVFQDLPCNGGAVGLSALQENKTKDDPIEYFQ